MRSLLSRGAALALAFAGPLRAQSTDDPFPTPLSADAPILAEVAEFASLPAIDGVPARMMLLVDEPGTRRLFVNDMRGPLYTLRYDGDGLASYLDIGAPRWGVPVESNGRERGFQSFAVHPQFARPGTPGFGKLYTWSDTEDTDSAPDFRPGGGARPHDTVLLEWTARDPTAPTYDGDPPRELLRVAQPFANHNAGRLAFNPLARRGDADFGLLYVGLADGGSGGDPLGMAQSLGAPFGKILRIDPLGANSANGRYGIPASNPFAADGGAATLGEIWAYGLRNPQHFAWDGDTGRMFTTDIGQGTVEEVSVVTPGANLGWNRWEGSFRFVDRGTVSLADPRGDPAVTFPVAEYDHSDPLLQGRVAVTGLAVGRGGRTPSLEGQVVFGDLPSGELFAFPADTPPDRRTRFRRVLLLRGGSPRTLLELIQAKNRERGQTPAARADLRFHPDGQGRIFLLNKADGVIRVLGEG